MLTDLPVEITMMVEMAGVPGTTVTVMILTKATIAGTVDTLIGVTTEMAAIVTAVAVMVGTAIGVVTDQEVMERGDGRGPEIGMTEEVTGQRAVSSVVKKAISRGNAKEVAMDSRGKREEGMNPVAGTGVETEVERTKEMMLDGVAAMLAGE